MGSSNSCPIQCFINSRRSLGKVMSCDYHVWTSGFVKEYALVYSSRDTEPGIRTICYSECCYKVIFTLYDNLCEDNLVAVNIELVAERDDDGLYKFGATKVKEFGDKFRVRRRRSIGPELLFLSYEMGGRKNQLALHRVQGEKYEEFEIVFDSKSPLVLPHKSVRIFCDPSRGLVAYTTPQNGQQSLLMNCHNEPPRYDVMKVIKDVRSQLKDQDAGSAISHGGNNNTGPSLPSSKNIYNIIYNAGNFQGDCNGCINNN